MEFELYGNAEEGYVLHARRKGTLHASLQLTQDEARQLFDTLAIVETEAD